MTEIYSIIFVVLLFAICFCIYGVIKTTEKIILLLHEINQRLISVDKNTSEIKYLVDVTTDVDSKLDKLA